MKMLTFTQPYITAPPSEPTVTGLWITGRTWIELVYALTCYLLDTDEYDAASDRLHRRLIRNETQSLAAADCRGIVAAATHCLSLPELPRGTTQIGMQTLQAMGLGGLQRIREKRGAVMN